MCRLSLRLHQKKASNAKDLRAGRSRGRAGRTGGRGGTTPSGLRDAGQARTTGGSLASRSQHIVHPSRPPTLSGAGKGRLSGPIHCRKWLPCDLGVSRFGSQCLICYQVTKIVSSKSPHPSSLHLLTEISPTPLYCFGIKRGRSCRRALPMAKRYGV